MKNLLIGLILFATSGCSTYIANDPFSQKAVSDKAIEAPGTVEYTRKVSVVPTEVAVAVQSLKSVSAIHTNLASAASNTNNTFKTEAIPPAVIDAVVKIVTGAVTPTIKNVEDDYIKLRGAAQIEVEETYKHTSK